MAEANDLFRIEEAAYGWIFPTERSTDNTLEVPWDVSDDELVFLGGLHLQAVGLVDGVDAEVSPNGRV